jgi:hypothetical protein
MEKFKPTGHLQILKIYDDGTEEVHFDESNMIVSGLGVGLSHLFAGSGASQISDYQVLNFQVGVSGDETDYGPSSYKLTNPCTEAQYLSTGSESFTESLKPIQNGVVVSDAEAFVRFPFNNIQKVDKNTIRFNLILDKYTLTGLGNPLNEVGLFMRNPRGSTPPRPILIAYRPFTSLTKTSTFALLFKWTLNF